MIHVCFICHIFRVQIFSWFWTRLGEFARAIISWCYLMSSLLQIDIYWSGNFRVGLTRKIRENNHIYSSVWYCYNFGFKKKKININYLTVLNVFNTPFSSFTASKVRCDILDSAFQRYFSIIFFGKPQQAVDRPHPRPAKRVLSGSVVGELDVQVNEPCPDYPTLESDESCKLLFQYM